MHSGDVIELGAIDAAQAIAEGALSAEAYAGRLLDRCDALAFLNAFITVDRDLVLSQARAADADRAAGKPLGPLHGVPFAIKDNIDVAGLPATAGTPALLDNRPARDAAVVARLRAAGAIMLGKTSMHELAAGVTNDNVTFGTAQNPYDGERVPGGSSGGTAIAVGARMAPCGLGTDTGASNRVPAAFCGVVGFRPSTGRWSQQGLIANSQTRDTAGPMARTVADCALIDEVVTGDGDRPQVKPDGLRIGIIRYFWEELEPEIESIGRECLDRLKRAGITLVEADMPLVGELTRRASLPIGVLEHRGALSAYLAAAGSPLGFDDVMAAIASPDVGAFFAEMRSRLREEDYQAAMNVHRPALQHAFRDCFASNGLDAMLFPTSPVTPPRIADTRSPAAGTDTGLLMAKVIRNTDPGSVAGNPGLSLPAGQLPSGLPFGLELDGLAGTDRHLLAIGAAIAPLLPPIRPPAVP